MVNYKTSRDYKRLKELREMILKWVEDKWNARHRKRLNDINKEIIKL